MISLSDTNNNSENVKNSQCQKKILSKLTTSEIVVLATTISIALTENRPTCEIKALLNIVNLVEDNIIAILAQKDICAESIQDFII